MRDNTANKNKSLDKVKPQVSHHNLIEGFYIKKEDNMDKVEYNRYNRFLNKFIMFTASDNIHRTSVWHKDNKPNVEKVSLPAEYCKSTINKEKKWAKALNEEDNFRGIYLKGQAKGYLFYYFGGLFGEVKHNEISTASDLCDHLLRLNWFQNEEHLMSFALYLTIGMYLVSETRKDIYKVGDFHSKPSDREDMELLAKHIYSIPFGVLGDDNPFKDIMDFASRHNKKG